MVQGMPEVPLNSLADQPQHWWSLVGILLASLTALIVLWRLTTEEGVSLVLGRKQRRLVFGGYWCLVASIGLQILLYAKVLTLPTPKWLLDSPYSFAVDDINSNINSALLVLFAWGTSTSQHAGKAKRQPMPLAYAAPVAVLIILLVECLAIWGMRLAEETALSRRYYNLHLTGTVGFAVWSIYYTSDVMLRALKKAGRRTAGRFVRYAGYAFACCQIFLADAMTERELYPRDINRAVADFSPTLRIPWMGLLIYGTGALLSQGASTRSRGKAAYALCSAVAAGALVCTVYTLRKLELITAPVFFTSVAISVAGVALTLASSIIGNLLTGPIRQWLIAVLVSPPTSDNNALIPVKASGTTGPTEAQASAEKKTEQEDEARRPQ